nr:MAG TPA: hypothetical protein [Caudoviricetes sp.]
MPRLYVTRLRFESKARYFFIGSLFDLTAVYKFLQQCRDFLIGVSRQSFVLYEFGYRRIRLIREDFFDNFENFEVGFLCCGESNFGRFLFEQLYFVVDKTEQVSLIIGGRILNESIQFCEHFFFSNFLFHNFFTSFFFGTFIIPYFYLFVKRFEELFQKFF